MLMEKVCCKTIIRPKEKRINKQMATLSEILKSIENLALESKMSEMQRIIEIRRILHKNNINYKHEMSRNIF